MIKEGTIGRMLSIPRRFVRMRGFGVHSPFAFRFLGNVVREHNAYYSYDAINAIGSSVRERKLLRLIFRVAVDGGHKVCSVLGHSTGNVWKALELSGAVRGENPTFTVCGCIGDDDMEVLGETARRGGTLLFYNLKSPDSGTRKAVERLYASLDRGMLFGNGKIAILVCDAKLPKQRYEIWI